MRVLDDARGEQHDCEHERDRKQDAQRGTHEIDPEVPDRALARARQPPDQRGHHGHAGRGGHELLHRQADHLGEVAERRLAGVALPVGVRHEADRSVQRERGLDVGHVGRVERETALDALHEVQQEEPDDAEREHRQRVDVPALLALRVNAARPVDQPLDRREHAVEA
jgi:hypothetical protein